ncbi:hypothetical protein C0033_02085 [Clostridium sp. chh4-2]|uniref:FRG domain-containing protein n=1 Tax=Clostridium sp. chh4-2 TaxID=2067550 RepID=UPI000CCF3765|nr:FRG domain-containing protein [Clostridium sp. chh4-2]PNV63476.1 hypothetical protein C0033_02085 [Clostridium sp. chh4-2]
MAEYLFPIDNKIHDLTWDDIKKLHNDNLMEEREGRKITASSDRGENYWDQYEDFNTAMYKEYLYRDPKTSGMRIEYPHGVVIQQSRRRNFYRGENQIYPSSVPSLLRRLREYDNTKQQELYRLVADMRVYEFGKLLNCFDHVKNWKRSDVLYEPLAQHYGLETCWLDITSDFDVALFFAACCYKDGKWHPLTKEQTEKNENTKYGMIYHMPSSRMSLRWNIEVEKFSGSSNEVAEYKEDGSPYRYRQYQHPEFLGGVSNLIYPLGFQPFMRCHMQDGYGIYMREEKPLQQDPLFEKLRFKHSEELSNWIFDYMRGGELIYPHEGLSKIDFLINAISGLTVFSYEAFLYALERNHLFALKEEELCLKELDDFSVNGKKIIIQDKSPWKLSSGKRKRINAEYDNFSIEDAYGILVKERKVIPPGARMFSPWMIMENENEPGVVDFHARELTGCTNLWTLDYLNILYTVECAQEPPL